MRLVLRFLLRYARPYLPIYLLGLGMLAATNYAVVRIPVLIGNAFDLVEAGGVSALGDVRRTALELGILAFLLVIARTISRIAFFNPGREVELALAVALFRHLLRLQRPFFARHSTGELASLTTNDTQSVRLLVGFAGLQVVNVAVALPLHLVQMIELDPWLTLACIWPVVLGAGYMRSIVWKFYGLVRQSQAELGRISQRMLECYAGVATIRAHGAEVAMEARVAESTSAQLAIQDRLAVMRAFSLPVLATCGLVSTAVVLAYGGERVISGRSQIGELAAFMALLVSLVGTLTALAWVLTAVSRGVSALQRVQEVLDTPIERQDSAPTVAENREPPRLEIRGLRYAYEVGRPVLDEISIDVQPGATLGVFGSTGAGKTTLIELLAGLHRPEPETIWIDGLDASSLPLGVLREGMAVVPQDPFLFSATLRDNIRLRGEHSGHGAGDSPSSTVGYDHDEALRDVVRAACLEPDLEQFAQGLDTPVGERGVTLSGGQRQRTALARALYARPRLLLLDDVLSAVDQGTAEQLITAIRALRGGVMGRAPTTVIVSHRTAVLEHADEIVVLDRGRIAERGDHAALLSRGGIYAEAHEHQRHEGAES